MSERVFREDCFIVSSIQISNQILPRGLSASRTRARCAMTTPALVVDTWWGVPADEETMDEEQLAGYPTGRDTASCRGTAQP